MWFFRGLTITVAALLMACATAASGQPAEVGAGPLRVTATPAPNSERRDGPLESKSQKPEPQPNLEPIATGFRGHFSCQTFSGANRELAIAVSDLQVARVSELMAAGADINAHAEASHTRGMTILETAVWHRWGDDCILLLIAAGADLEARDQGGNTALIYACQGGIDPQLDVLASLMKNGAQVNVRGARGMTPLMHAAMQDRAMPVVEVLLNASADVHAQDDNGWTALMHCTRNRGDRAQVAQRLIAAGADVNVRHRHGGTALLNAAYHGRARVVDVLLAAGASVNIADEAGWTPLIGASMNGHTEVVRALLQAGADPAARDRLGRNALDLAQANQHAAIVSLLTAANE